MECKQFHGKGSVENVVLHEEDWKKSWENRQIGFHFENVNKDLIEYEAQLLKEKTRIFVPLCGKSVDLNYLADKGHDVVGCECSDIAILEFFDEHSITYERSQHDRAPFEIFKGINKNITIYKGDFFELTSDVIGRFNAVWDRSSLVAIHPTQRNSYADIMYDLLNPGATYILNIFEHTSNEGHPFSVSDNDVADIFGHYFNISMLDSYENNDLGFVKAKGLPYAIESNLLLTRK